MKDLILYLTKSLVDKPDQADATVAQEGETTRIALHVAEEDKGKIIGKQGKVIKAMREVASMVGAKAGKKVVLDLE